MAVRQLGICYLPFARLTLMNSSTKREWINVQFAYNVTGRGRDLYTISVTIYDKESRLPFRRTATGAPRIMLEMVRQALGFESARAPLPILANALRCICHTLVYNDDVSEEEEEEEENAEQSYDPTRICKVIDAAFDLFEAGCKA